MFNDEKKPISHSAKPFSIAMISLFFPSLPPLKKKIIRVSYPIINNFLICVFLDVISIAIIWMTNL